MKRKSHGFFIGICYNKGSKFDYGLKIEGAI